MTPSWPPEASPLPFPFFSLTSEAPGRNAHAAAKLAGEVALVAKAGGQGGDEPGKPGGNDRIAPDPGQKARRRRTGGRQQAGRRMIVSRAWSMTPPTARLPRPGRHNRGGKNLAKRTSPSSPAVTSWARPLGMTADTPGR